MASFDHSLSTLMIDQMDSGITQSFKGIAMAEAANWSSVLHLPALATTACGLACFAADAVFAKDPCLVYRPREYARNARYSMNRALELQAMEARVLSQTVWNHHFEQYDADRQISGAELRASGRAHLDRLARRFPYGNFELSIQSAHDFQFTDDDHEAYFVHRRELDALRTKTVADYLQRVIPGNPVAIQIHDRPPVGISGNEALRAYSQMVNRASVTIPDDSNGPQFMFGVGAGGGGYGGGGLGGAGFGDGGFSGGGYGGAGLMSPSPSGSGPTDFSPPSFGAQTPTGPSNSPSGPPSGPPPSPNP